MKSKTLTFVALMSVVYIIAISSSEARDFDDLTRDPDYMMEVVNCVLDKGPCDDYAFKVKALIPEIFNNNCMKCTYDQRHKLFMMTAYMRMAYPDIWEEIQGKYIDESYMSTNN